MFITIFTICYFLLIAIIALHYKAITNKYSPYVTVLLPVFNEGESVFYTIKSIVNSNYYKHKFELIIINDGSTDNTYKFIRKAKYIFKDNNIKIINFNKNKGKKHALAAGIKQANGSIIVTVDSDSFVDRHAIKNIVKPFIDKSIGGVAGNIRVNNKRNNTWNDGCNILFLFCIFTIITKCLW